jgi:hypothetical protein
MTESPVSDCIIFGITPGQLLDGVRSASLGEEVDHEAAYILTRCLLLKDGHLTEPGNSLFKLAWVLRKMRESEFALGQALRQLTPIQVIEQEIKGLGAVPEDGILDLLRHHRAVNDDTTTNTLRPLFKWLSSVQVLIYSTKFKTVRALAPTPEAALAGEIQAIASMVSPKTPYLNLVKLRRVIRPLRGIVWWADAHFHPRALEELAEEIDKKSVDEIRILSGDADNVLTEKSMKDFRRFKTEMESEEISTEWRVDVRGVRDWHDRWIADDSAVWNIPPINTLLKNDYSEIFPATERPPFQTWWGRATARV